MNTVEDIEKSNEFDWFIPTPREAELTITIPNGNCLNFNAKLRVLLPSRITVGISKKDGKTICVAESPTEGYSLPKSGTLKDKHLMTKIAEHGLNLPARFHMKKNGEQWIGNLVISSPVVPVITKTPKKPRKNGLDNLIRKEEAK